MTFSKIILFSILFLVFSIGLIQFVSSEELPHFIKKELTCASTTTSATALTVVNGTDFNFLLNHKYLLLAEGKIGKDKTVSSVAIEVRHGATVFEGSHKEIEPRKAFNLCSEPDPVKRKFYNYLWFTVYEPTADEDLTIVIDNIADADISIYDDIKLVIIEISEKLIEDTDWFFNENFTDTTLGINFDTLNSATVTFTPPANNTKYIIIGSAQLDTGNDSQYESRAFLNFTDGTNSTNIVLSQQGEDPNEETFVQTFSALLNFNQTTTVTIQSQVNNSTAGINERLYNAVFVMNLDKFETKVGLLNNTAITINTGTPFDQEIDTINVTPLTTGDFLIYGGVVKLENKAFHMRLQTDNVDTPTSQTSDQYSFNDSWNAKDSLQTSIIDIVNLSNTTHTLDIDVNGVQNISNITARSLFAISMNVTPISDVTDSMILNDTNTFIVDRINNQSDTIILNDTNTFLAVLSRNQTDSMIINDTNSFIVDFAQNQSDTMIINDTNSFIVDVIQNQSDTMIINDTNSFIVDFAQNQSDTIILNDTNSFIAVLSRNQTDSMILNDTNTFLTVLSRNQTDSMIITDTNSFIVGVIQNQSDTMIMNDTNSFIVGIIQNQSDTMIINDTNSFIVDFAQNQSDTMIINDTNSFIVDVIQNVTNNMNFVDSNTFTINFVPILDPTDTNQITMIDASTFFLDVFVEPTPVVTGGGGVGTVGGAIPPTIPDSDGDGILDPEDACPLEPEDFDGFEDADGCPEGDFIQPPQPLSIPDLVDLIPFEFNELDVIDDYIELELGLPQPQVEDLAVRWLGAEQITITSIDIGLSPFEIKIQDIPITFGNNRFGYTETQLLYTVQPPDKICGNIITTDCLDEVTYKIPVVVTGVINGKTVIADGSITIDNSSRINPYWLAFFALILIPLLAIMFWKKRSTKVTTKQKLKLTQRPNTSRTLTVTKSKPLKSGTTRKLLTESKKTNILGKKTK